MICLLLKSWEWEDQIVGISEVCDQIVDRVNKMTKVAIFVVYFLKKDF